MTKDQENITNPKFVINRGKDGKFYWVLYAVNGKPLLRSVRGYATKQKAQNNIMSVIEHGQKPDHYDYDTANISGNGYYYFLHGRKKYNNNGELSKIAISANPNFFQSVNWQIAETGKDKSIQSCITHLARIKKQLDKNRQKIVDNTKKKKG